MPLYVSEKLMRTKEEIFENKFLEAKSHLFSEQGIVNVSENKKILFINQREYAIISTKDFDGIGTDDATTCCIVVMHNANKNLVGLTHVDKAGLQIGQLLEIAKDVCQGDCIDLYLVGSYQDPYCDISDNNVKVILNNLLETSDMRFDLKLCHVLGFNKIYKDNEIYPEFQGVVFDLVEGSISPATFQRNCRGPDYDLRGLYVYFGGNYSLNNIYNNEKQLIEIKPFDYILYDDDWDEYIYCDDEYVKSELSGRPLQENEYYAANIKSSLMFWKQNPDCKIYWERNRILI
jgi:hypothetical protein